MSFLSLGIDIGTSGVRCAVVDEDGLLVSSVKTQHEKQVSNFIDACDWWVAVKRCLTLQIEALRAQGHDPKSIAHAAVDGTSGSMVLVDQALDPVTSALMYNSGPFEAEAALIDTQAPEPHITRGGNSALARMIRLQSEDILPRATHLCHQADFILAKMIGYAGLSDHNNALKTGFDPTDNDWPEWFARCGIHSELLPKVGPSGAVADVIDRTLAQELGLNPGLLMHLGTTDSIAAFLAAAPLEEGVAVTSLGSTLAIKLLSKQRVDDSSIGLYSHRLGDYWLIGGASNTGGNVLRQHFSDQELLELSAQIDPNTPMGLNYYPLINKGERFPVNDPRFSGCMAPIPPARHQFLQAIFEGIADVEAQCFEQISQRGGTRPSRILTAGGGAQNPVWTEIRARRLGITLSLAEHVEAAVGAARLAQPSFLHAQQ